jgi:hypothetical protein
VAFLRASIVRLQVASTPAHEPSQRTRREPAPG